MLIFIKIITSALAITLITEIAKKHTLLAGLLAALPINIMITILWLYFEKRDISLLLTFTQSAFAGIFSTLAILFFAVFFIKRLSVQI